MAQYRAGDWKEAIAALEKSTSFAPRRRWLNWFFLAMAHWQLGDKDEARKWYDKGVEWMDKNQPKNEELRRFRAEAAELLGIEREAAGGKVSPTVDWMTKKAAGGVLTAKQAPHRPGTAPAHGLRTERAVVILSQTTPRRRRPCRFRTLLKSLKSRSVTSRPARRRRSRSDGTPRLAVEALDDRSLPSTFTVTNLLDSGARLAAGGVVAANANPGADTIDFATTGTIVLTSGQLDITDSVTINGPGAGALTVSGNYVSRVFGIAGDPTVVIAGLTVANGGTTSARSGGAASPWPAAL